MKAKNDSSQVFNPQLYREGMYGIFRRARLQNIIGQSSASITVVLAAWNYADHNRLLIYLVVHQCLLLLMALSFYLPWTNKRLSSDGIPKFGVISLVLAQLICGSALWINFAAASDYRFAFSSIIVMFACAAGSLVAIGPIKRLSRLSLFCFLLPGAIASLLLGHYVLGIGTLFFLVIVAIVGVEEMHSAYSELIQLRAQSTKAAEQFEYLANRDSLTELLNRAGITEHFESKRSELKSALFIDLDKFKQVNDEAGHIVGDILLKHVAMRLTNKVSDLGCVSRLGGDEFLILLYEMKEERIQELAESIISIVEKPFVIEGNQYFVSASIGVSLIFAQTTLEDVLKESDDAMYAAKRTGRSKVVFLPQDVRKETERDYLADAELRRTDWSAANY